MVATPINISQLLGRLDTLSLIDARMLEEQLEQKPWCAAYRILLARCHQNETSSLAEKKLHLASLYSGDREVLFNWMHKARHKTDHSEQTSDASSKGVEQEAFQSKPNEMSDQAEANEEGNEIPPEPAMEKPLGEANRHFEVDFDSIIKYDPARELKPSKKPKEEAVEIPFERISYNPELELEKLIEEKEKRAKESDQQVEMDFMFWLDHVGDEGAEIHQVESVEHDEVESNVDQVKNLLDAFLASKQRIKPVEQSFYKAESKANSSEIDQSDIISESLADLYLRKKLYQKSIETFEKLSLQNPSKSAYFAGRIRDVEELQRNSNQA